MSKKDTKLNYAELSKALKQEGPKRLYLLYGSEDYLRDSFLNELRKACFPDGGAEFGHTRFDTAVPDVRALSESVDALPFMSERSLIEVHGFDAGKCTEEMSKDCERIFSDIPEYCTLVFVTDTGVSPDKRKKIVKSMQKHGELVDFTVQEHGRLIPWIRRRFEARGKRIDTQTAEYLVYMSGANMSGLVQEIEKIAVATQGEEISKRDIDNFASKIVEARVFEMTDALSARDYGKAARLMADLMATDEEPIMILAVIGLQFRRLYAARLGMAEGRGMALYRELYSENRDFILKKTEKTASSFRLKEITYILSLCAETDYAMKSSVESSTELLRGFLLSLSTMVRR